VVISTDYDGNGNPCNFTWTALNPVLADGPADDYSEWVSSGDVDLSSFRDIVYIAFKYDGADPSGTASDKTTTWQIDNVLIFESVSR